MQSLILLDMLIFEKKRIRSKDYCFNLQRDEKKLKTYFEIINKNHIETDISRH